MKHIDFEFNGRTYALSCTAAALFDIYDKWGWTADVLAATHAMEATPEGWEACCWLLASFAKYGELQRRLMGEDAAPMLRMEELRLGAMPTDAARIRQAVVDTLRQGFHQELPNGEAAKAETDLVLQKIQEDEKKTALALASALVTMRSVFQSFISRGKTRT